MERERAARERVREARDAELALEGWTRRFVGAPPRLEEVTSLYESLGLEVLLDPLSPAELPPGCDGCSLATGWFRAIYTRPRAAAAREAEDDA